MTSITPPLRLLFVILAHRDPEQVAKLAHTLTDAASDGHAIIHFDARAAPEAFAELERRVAGRSRVELVRQRHRCNWGDYTLVAATLRALEERRRAGGQHDYVVLLSGSCLPCRPIVDFERFLAANRGREFIEVAGPEWIFDGLRSERHRLYFTFPPGRRRWLDRLNVALQQAVGVDRRFPSPLRPRFGSQWWTLTWDTCGAVLDHLAAHPATARFFRYTYIPDELVFPSLVDHLVPAPAIAGVTPTHFQFTNWGKAVVYYDDHVDYVTTLDRFFVRKVSPEAGRLRARCLARARNAGDEPLTVERMARPRHDYAVRVRAQSAYPRPGQMFYRDQFTDQDRRVLAGLDRPYVVLVGPAACARRLQRRLQPPTFAPIGAPFRNDRIDLGPECETWAGLTTGDRELRDLHPALYLTRLRTRAAGVPVLTWSPFDHLRLLGAVLDDPAALVVRFAAWTADHRRGRHWLQTTCAPGDETPGHVPGQPTARWSRARLDHHVAGTGADWAFDRLAAPPTGSPCPRLVTLPLPLSAADARNDEACRAAVMRAGLDACLFRSEPWFPALVAALERAWAEDFGDPRHLEGARAPADTPSTGALVS